MKKENLDIIDIRKALHDAGMKQNLAEVWAQILCKKTEVQADGLATKEKLENVREVLSNKIDARFDKLEAKIEGILRFNTFAMIYFSAFLGIIILLIEYHFKK